MNLFRALKAPNFRLFFAGQTISLMGTWMQHVALAWLVYRLTRSPMVLGAVAFAAHAPTVLVAPLAGVLADRFHRRNLFLAMQVLAMLQAAALALLAGLGIIALWQILALAVLSGVIHAMDIPSRQSLFVELVNKKEDLVNAIALNSSMFNFARLAGPAVAGVLVATRGETVCFVLNALSYLPIIAAMLWMKLPRRKKEEAPPPVLRGLKDGVRYIWGSPPIRAILLMLALIGFMGIPHSVLLPVFASEILHGGPRTLGFLVAASGFGAVLGALVLASRKTVAGLEGWVPLASVAFGVGLLAFAHSRSVAVSTAVLFVTGFTLMLQMGSSNTVIQTIVEEDKRGRVMSFYMISFMGVAPFGNLLFGSLAERIGAPETISLGAAACLAGALYFFTKMEDIRAAIRPAYVKSGILPPVAAGLETARQMSAAEEK